MNLIGMMAAAATGAVVSYVLCGGHYGVILIGVALLGAVFISAIYPRGA